MKKLRGCCLILVFLSMLCYSSFAADILDEQAERYGVSDLESALPQEAVEALGAITVSEASDTSKQLEKLWTSVTGQSQDLFFSALRGAAEVLLAAFLTALFGVIAESGALSIAGAAAVALISVRSVTSCAAVGREALGSMMDFSHVLLPCLCTAAAAGGAFTSASAKYAASMLFLDGLVTAEIDFALPLLFTYTALFLAGQITENSILLSIAGLFKQGMKWALIFLTLAFTIYLSITGILSGTVDAAAAKAAKTAISGALPVVGGILSDASSALLSGAQILRNGVGVLGLLAVLAVCITPYLTLASHFLVYRIAGSAAGSFGEKRIGGVIKGLGDVYAMLLGMVGSVSLMLFVSIVSFMRTVTPG